MDLFHQEKTMRKIIYEIDADSLGGTFCGDNDDLQAIVDYMNEHSDDDIVFHAHTATGNGGRIYYADDGGDASADGWVSSRWMEKLFGDACLSVPHAWDN